MTAHRHSIMDVMAFGTFLARYCPRCTPHWRTYPKTLEDERLERRRFRRERAEAVSALEMGGRRV
jgi:hypothetical protein